MDHERFANCREKLLHEYDTADYTSAPGLSGEEIEKNIRSVYFGASDLQIGKAEALRFCFENARILYNENDIFADLIEDKKTPVLLRSEMTRMKKQKNEVIDNLRREGVLFADADYGHIMPDWKYLLSKGISGVIAEAESLLAEAKSESAKSFYRSCVIAYSGIKSLMLRFAVLCSESGSQNGRLCAENLIYIAANPPKTFAQALQLMLLIDTCQTRFEGANVRSLGGLDRLLYDYYLTEVKENGSDESVRECLRFFFFKYYCKKVCANMPFYIGGIKEDGKCANELTRIIIETYSELDIYDPKIHVKYNKELSSDIIKLILDSIRKGNNSFVFISDEVVRNCYRRMGICEKDVGNYSIMGCYEPCIEGKEAACTCNGAIMLPCAVESALCGGKRLYNDHILGNASTDASDYAAFEDLKKAVFCEIKYYIDESIKQINDFESLYPSLMQAPILSATYENCRKTGTDLFSYGAQYNNSSVCVFGIGTITDTLLAIKKAVYEEKLLTLPALTEILRNNWKDNEVLRRKMYKYPKYGSNNAEADELADEILRFCSDNLNMRKNARGGIYRMGTFSIDHAVEYARKLGASADGRFFGEPCSKNMRPSNGCDKEGLTGIMTSSLKHDYTLIPDGTVLDLTVHPTTVAGEEGLSAFEAILRTYLDGGGFAVHFNVMSREILQKAEENPEKYKNLQVRRCGWNVYYLDLDKDSRKDLMESMA